MAWDKKFSLFYTIEEGGEWREMRAHSIKLPTGQEYDAVNGWRKCSELFKFERSPELGNPDEWTPY